MVLRLFCNQVMAVRFCLPAPRFVVTLEVLMEHLAVGNHILVEEFNNEGKSDGGIIIPEGTVSASSMRCQVVSVSENIMAEREMRGHNMQYPVSVGDTIYKAYHIGTLINTKDGRKLWALHIDNVLSVEVPEV